MRTLLWSQVATLLLEFYLLCDVIPSGEFYLDFQLDAWLTREDLCGNSRGENSMFMHHFRTSVSIRFVLYKRTHEVSLIANITKGIFV